MRLSKTVAIAAVIGAMTTASLDSASAARRNSTGAAVAAGVIGLAIGGIIASQARPRTYYYGPGYYYPPPVYYGPPPVYYGPPAVYYGPAAAYGDPIAYCMSRFKSYDPYSMTYLGYDGRRHPCP